MLKELQKSMSVDQRLEITVWDPNNDRVEFNFHSYIMDVEGTFFMVAPPGKDIQKIAPLMQPGMLVGAVLDSNPALYIFYPTMHRYQEKPKAGYWLKLLDSTQVEVVQRRRHVRIPMQVPFRVEHLIGANHWVSVDTVTEDVSGGGMRFTSQRQFFKDQDLRLYIQFHEEQPKLVLKARVVFSAENRLRRRKDDFYVTACQFYDVEPHEETVVVRECFRRELGLRR
jgi:c-di-GMP-binding flagellar brake protein YcgR